MKLHSNCDFPAKMLQQRKIIVKTIVFGYIVIIFFQILPLDSVLATNLASLFVTFVSNSMLPSKIKSFEIRNYLVFEYMSLIWFEFHYTWFFECQIFMLPHCPSVTKVLSFRHTGSKLLCIVLIFLYWITLIL